MTDRSFLPVDEQLARIQRGAVDLVEVQDLRARLEQSRKSGKPLRVKLGIDPTSPDIHVGHTVVLRKLRTFQDLGHRVVLIWGTATARLGDPSGRDKTRPQLSRDDVEENLRTYKAQVGKILDVDRAEHRENAEWFDGMGFWDTVTLLARMTVARAIERDSFEKRMKAGQPVSLHEIVYPLMQGWDSVEIDADVEIGATDQLFNLLVGRDLMAQQGKPAQVCLTLPLIEGLDGVQKMSKSYGNYIGIDDPPNDMFGKVMSVPDALMEKYFLLLTDLDQDEVAKVLAGHPREAKARLGRELVTWLHGAEAATTAEAEFDRVFKERQLPSDIPEFEVPEEAMRDGAVFVATAVAGAFGVSGGEARRLMGQNGVKVGGETVSDIKAVLPPGRHLVQVGKRRFCHVTVS